MFNKKCLFEIHKKFTHLLLTIVLKKLQNCNAPFLHFSFRSIKGLMEDLPTICNIEEYFGDKSQMKLMCKQRV